MGKMKFAGPLKGNKMDFESCRFDFRIDSKNGLTPSKRKKAERKGVNNFTLFKCKVCGSLFDSRPSLLEHKMTHNKFKCVFCEARFARQTWMMDHVAVVHGMGEVSAKRKRKASAPVPRKLLPKPMDDVDLGTTTVISESDSEPPSPLSSPTQQIDCPSPMLPLSAGLSPGSMIDVSVPSKLPDLLPMSLPLPMTPKAMPISPQTFGGTNSPALQGLSTPQLLTSPPQLVPAYPSGSSASIPQLPYTNTSVPSDVPCIYINVPVLISSGDSGTSITETQPLISAAPPAAPTSTVSSCPLLTTPLPSLLPVNPFVRKDIPPANHLDLHQRQPRLRHMDIEPNDVRSPGIQQNIPNLISPVFNNNSLVPMTLEVPLSGLIDSTNPPMFMPAVQEDQAEALDFSVKPCTTKQTQKFDSANQQQVFHLGIKDPSATLAADDMETVVDLSQKSETQSKPSEDNKVNDDKIIMQQEYKSTQKSQSNSLKSTDEKLNKTGTKRNKTVLDKMVQKLWQSKMSKKDNGDGHKVQDNDGAENLSANSSLGRVYVLNELPEQIETYAPGSVRGNKALDLTHKEETPSRMGALNHVADKVLQSAAASIAGAVMSDAKPTPQVEQNDNKFCAIKFHTCRVCKQLFYSAEEMWEHAVTHQDFHKYKCNQCSYITACHRELINHKQATHGHDMQKDGRHICNYPGCMRSYSEWRYLRDHQKSHHQMEERSASYVSPPSSQAGSPVKPGRLVCDYSGCFKTFKEWRHLKVHQTLHTGEKPLSCQLCNYACRHRSSMNWHMKSKHGLDKMKTQGNRTVYVDSNRRVVCGWSDEANREVNYLKNPDLSKHDVDVDIKPRVDELNGITDYSSLMDESLPPSAENSQYGSVHSDMKLPIGQMECSTSVSMTSSRPPSCAPSDNPSERSLMDDPHMLMLKMQAKPTEFPLNMSVQIEDLSPKEQMVGEDGRITSKMSDVSDKMSDRLMIDTSQDGGNYGNTSEAHSPPYTPSTVSSSMSSSEASSMVTSENNRLVMTPVACANIGQGADHQASMMKFKLKYLVVPKYFPCKVCNENFDSAAQMWQHRIKEHKDCTQFYCDSCGYDTTSMQDLQSHMLGTHGKEMGGQKNFVCFICGKGYSTKTGLNQHMLRHSAEGPPQYECPYENCASKVHSKCALKNHIRRVHLKVPPKYQCPEEGCNRRFESSSALKNHHVLHTEYRPLECSYPGCDKSFRESKHLKVHRMQHTDEKPLKCDACDYTCRQRNSMNWHMKSKHNREKSVSPDGRTIYVPIVN